MRCCLFSTSEIRYKSNSETIHKHIWKRTLTHTNERTIAHAGTNAEGTVPFDEYPTSMLSCSNLNKRNSHVTNQITVLCLWHLHWWAMNIIVTVPPVCPLSALYSVVPTVSRSRNHRCKGKILIRLVIIVRMKWQ